mgnify:CR=1 FL=1
MILTNEKSSKDEILTAAAEQADLLTSSEKQVLDLKEDRKALLVLLLISLAWQSVF